MPFAAIALLTLQLAFEMPEVRAAGACPSAADVTALLAPLLPAATGERRPPDVAEVADRGGELRVLLRGAEGDVMHDRVLVAGPSCAERARAVAAIIAAWEADLHADVAFPTQSAPPTQAEVEPAPLELAPRPPSRITRPVASARHEAVLGAPVPSVVTVGGQILAAAPGGSGPAPAGSVEVTWSRRGPIHARAAILATGTHSVTLAPGSVSWRRAALGLGAVADLTRGRILASARADAIVAAVLSEGQGFHVDQSATSWQIGVDLGGRVGLALTPRLSLWADLAVVDFPGVQRFSVENAGAAPPIPRTELQAGLGLSFHLSR